MATGPGLLTSVEERENGHRVEVGVSIGKAHLCNCHIL